MNNQALWQAVAALLVVAADLVVEKIRKLRGKEPQK